MAPAVRYLRRKKKVSILTLINMEIHKNILSLQMFREGGPECPPCLWNNFSTECSVCLIIYILILYSLQKGDVQGTTEWMSYTDRGLSEGGETSSKRALWCVFPKNDGSLPSLCERQGKARDLLQDGFVKIFTSMDSYTGSGSFEGWMRKIFVNCALEYLRKSDVLREATDLDNTAELIQPDSSAISDMSAAELMNLVKELPVGFRTVFNMFAIEGYSHKEISEMLNITESTSRSQYTRAKQLLQRRINALYWDKMSKKERDIWDDAIRSKLEDFEMDTLPGDWEL